MGYSPQQQKAYDAATKVYRERIENMRTTLDTIEALSQARGYGGEYQTTHGENMVLKNLMKRMFMELRSELILIEELGIISKDLYDDLHNEIGERLIAFEAANPDGFKII